MRNKKGLYDIMMRSLLFCFICIYMPPINSVSHYCVSLVELKIIRFFLIFSCLSNFSQKLFDNVGYSVYFVLLFIFFFFKWSL